LRIEQGDPQIEKIGLGFFVKTEPEKKGKGYDDLITV